MHPVYPRQQLEVRDPNAFFTQTQDAVSWVLCTIPSMTDRIPPRLADHPTVRKVRSRPARSPASSTLTGCARCAFEAGRDDVAFAGVDNPDLASEREHVDAALPGTQSYISLVVKMNRDNVRSTARSVANQEFHRSGEIMNEAAHRITRALQDAGYRAINPSMSFPMEMDRFPGRIWVVAHKPVAVAAGLGVMGIHRNVIHPKFGNFILARHDAGRGADQRVTVNRWTIHRAWSASCASRRVRSARSRRTANSTSSHARCTTTASSWAGSPTGWKRSPTATDAADFRSRVSDSENASMWQSLSFKANYKAAYCLAVCPAGEDVIEPYLDDRKGFMDLVLKPLQQKRETLYVLPNSAAKAHAERRFPHKQVKVVDSGIGGRCTTERNTSVVRRCLPGMKLRGS